MRKRLSKVAVVLALSALTMALVIGCGGPFGGGQTIRWDSDGHPANRFGGCCTPGNVAEQQVTSICEDLLETAEAQVSVPVDATGKPLYRFSGWPASGKGPALCPTPTPTP